jgi:nitrogen PTS system EIIA component
MKLSQILKKESIVSELTSTTKPGILKELARAVAPVAGIDAEGIAGVLMERESLGSTGIGGGIAIPHGKLGGVADIILGFGRSRSGVEYESLDGRPVHLFFPAADPGKFHRRAPQGAGTDFQAAENGILQAGIEACRNH